MPGVAPDRAARGVLAGRVSRERRFWDSWARRRPSSRWLSWPWWILGGAVHWSAWLARLYGLGAVLASASQPRRILILGAGVPFPIHGVARLPAGRIVAVNISEGAIRAAVWRIRAPVVHVQCDAHALPFPDRSFSAVFGAGMLHHLDCSVAVP